MMPVPMRPAQNGWLIVALFLVAGAVWPWRPAGRLSCAAAAIAIVVSVLVARLRAHTDVARKPAAGDLDARIERIRAERAARMGPRRGKSER